MNDWISWLASMRFCSISNVQLLQLCLGPGHAHDHTDTLVHRLGRRPFHVIQLGGPQTRGVLHPGWTLTEVKVFPSQLLVLIVRD